MVPEVGISTAACIHWMIIQKKKMFWIALFVVSKINKV